MGLGILWATPNWGAGLPFSRMENEANRTLLKFSKGKCHILGQAGHLQSRTWDHHKTTPGDHVPFWTPQSEEVLGVLGPAQLIHHTGWDALSIAGSVFLVGGKGKVTANLSWDKRSSSLPILTLRQT